MHTPPVEDSIRTWASLLHCPERSQVVPSRDGVRSAVYGPCDSESEVAVHIVEGLGHVWPGGISLLPERLVGKASDALQANDVMWEFFQRHPKPSR